MGGGTTLAFGALPSHVTTTRELRSGGGVFSSIGINPTSSRSFQQLPETCRHAVSEMVGASEETGGVFDPLGLATDEVRRGPRCLLFLIPPCDTYPTDELQTTFVSEGLLLLHCCLPPARVKQGSHSHGSHRGDPTAVDMWGRVCHSVTHSVSDPPAFLSLPIQTSHTPHIAPHPPAGACACVCPLNCARRDLNFVEDFPLPAARGGAEAREGLHACYRGCAGAVVRPVSRPGSICFFKHPASRGSISGTAGTQTDVEVLIFVSFPQRGQ